MNIKTNILILTIIAAVMTSCSNSDSIFEEDAKKYQNATGISDAENWIPMRFRVNNIADINVSSMTSRADASALVDPSLVGKEIGLFVILDTDYERALQGEELKSGFRYSNIRGTILSDGSIEISDTILYYPLHQQSKMAVIAYAPYRADTPDSILYKGEMMQISDNQTESDLMFENDLLVGIPSNVHNPFRVLPEDPTDLTPQTIPLTFSHAFSRIIVDVEMAYNDIELKCQNVTVKIDSIPLEAQVNILTGAVTPTPLPYGSVKMLSTPYSNGTLNNGIISYRTTSIVFPQQYNNLLSPEISVTLSNRLGERADTTITRPDVHYTDFIKGHDVHYSVRIGL